MARLDFGLTDDEFGNMTPYQFEGLLDRHKQRMDREELLNGILASTVANCGFARPEEPVAPRDFMPSQMGKPPEAMERMTAEDFSRAMHRVAAGINAGLAARNGKKAESAAKITDSA